MSSIMTRWSVVDEYPVAGDDLDPDGLVTDRAIERWVAHACAAYLGQCTTLAATRARLGLELRTRTSPLPDRAGRALSPSVVVTASATEVLPTSFVIAVRLRPVGGDQDAPVNITSEVWLAVPATGEAHEIGDDIRDELIALEHAARHFN